MKMQLLCLNIKRYLALVICVLSFSPSILGQTTIVSGRVIDQLTGEGLPFVKVFFRHTKIATSTDIDGYYKLESYYATDSVSAQMVGYALNTQKINKDESSTVNFSLSETVGDLGPLVVAGNKKDTKDEPAWILWKKIQRNKKINNKEKLESYQYETYNKIQFDLNNLTEKFTKRKVFKHFNFIFDNVDSTGEKPSLPIFMTESLSDFYYRKNPKAQREYINATRISGIENESVSQFMGDMYQNVNIYDSKIPVFGKSFISPIAGNARIYYDLFLTDSAMIDGYWCYKLVFLPKRKQEPTFTGDMWINDTTFAIKEVTASIADDANINFVQTLEVKQKYEQVEKEIWMLTHDDLHVDFYLTNNTMGFYGKKSSSYKNFVINKPKPNDFYEGGQNIFIADGVNAKTDEFWEHNRHDSLNSTEQQIFSMMDTLETIPQIRSYIDIITLLVTGYKAIGKVEIGPITKFYSSNLAEGHRFGFGMKTSNDFSTRLEFKGNVAYGLNDKIFKYGGGFRYMLSKKPRQVISSSYKYDVEQLGLSQNAFSQDNVLSTLFSRNPISKLTLTNEYKGTFNREWFPGFSSEVIFKWRQMSPHPLGSLEYVLSDASGRKNINNITTSEITYHTRFAYDEKFIDGEFNRVSLSTKYPILSAQYSYGIPKLFGADYEYHKLAMSVTHWFPIGIFGWSKYTLTAGKYWGVLPYPLLEIFDGNETYFSQKKAFNTMNYFEFVADQYVTLFYTHHFDGFFLNKLPLFRKLKWREVITFHSAFGNFDNKHTQELDLIEGMFILKAPYMEASIGIENIFKFLRIDLIKRINYLENPNAIDWGIRAMFDVAF